MNSSTTTLNARLSTVYFCFLFSCFFSIHFVLAKNSTRVLFVPPLLQGSSEKAYEFDGPVFKVKGIHSDWMDEKVLDEEKLEMANPPQTKWKWENGIGELRVQ